MFIIETIAGKWAFDLRGVMDYLRNACEGCVLSNGSDLLKLGPNNWEEVEQFVSSHYITAVAQDARDARRSIYFAEITNKEKRPIF